MRDGQNRAARVGKWTYTPVSTGSALEKGATLQCEGLEVDLQYSSSVFEDFLDVVRRIQNEFNRRSQEAASLKTPAGECSGQMFRE
ncbi:hypothetical protein [Streptomyces sp. 3211.6]|uniref:hypothetical protein n=1 Tax=Streptomyces sp. 3211.6 TaxID=1938845 RepID=UPI0009A526F1|nr:hypothetical protein [Streptomyces sp. 3211.6]